MDNLNQTQQNNSEDISQAILPPANELPPTEPRTLTPPPNPVAPVALTPVPKVTGKAMTMDFYDAVKEIMKGSRVARLVWQNGDYCVLKDSFLTIFTKGNFFDWSINDGDVEGQDWVKVEELNASN